MSGREAILRVEVSHRLPQSRFDFDLAFAARGTGLFGANGVGKTTLLDFISGVKQPERGQIKSGQAIWFDSDRNRNLAQHKRRVARVFQDGRLMPHLTVEQNLNFAARGAGRSSVFSADRALIEEELKLEHLFDQRPGQLSGGEKQRVALACALITDSRLILLDEPFVGMDAVNRVSAIELVRKLTRSRAQRFILVSHDVRDLVALCEETVVFKENGAVVSGDTGEVLTQLGDGHEPSGYIVLDAELIHHDVQASSSRLLINGQYLDVASSIAPQGPVVRLMLPRAEIMLAGLDAKVFGWGVNVRALVQGTDVMSRTAGVGLNLTIGDQAFSLTGPACVGSELPIEIGSEIQLCCNNAMIV